MKWSSIAVSLGCLLAGASVSFAQASDPEDLEAIKQKLEQQERTIEQLQNRVQELETGEPMEPMQGPPVPVTEPGEAPSPMEEKEAEIAVRQGRRTPVIFRNAFNDQQTAAARAGDYVLDPTFRGFIEIPNTALMIKFNARPRVDFTADTADAGTDFRFVPAEFPTDSDKGWRFGANSNGSQLRVDMRAPTVDGNFRFYYENDFFDSNERNMQYRLRHLYGEFYGILGGFTYGVFEDPDAWPDTVDYEGPNSVIFARRAVGQYKLKVADEWALTIGIEDPDVFIDTEGDPGADERFRAPDTGFAVKWVREGLGHVRFSGIVRSIGINGDDFGDDDALGWGLNASASLRITKRTTTQLWFVVGRGVGGMGNDTSFEPADAAFNDSGNLRPLSYHSTMIAFTHRWTPRWRTTITHGFVQLGNTDAQNEDAYDSSHYASVNLVYNIFKRVTVGLEGLWGRKEVKSGSQTDVFRIHLGLGFSIFD